MTRKRQPMPSLPRVQASYRRQLELLEGMRAELVAAMQDYELAHDAGLQALASGMGKFGSRSSNYKQQAPEAGYEFHRLQGACAFAAGLIIEAERDVKRGTQRLERAGSAMLNAWLDCDPEIGRERRAIRAAAVQPLTPNHTPGILPGVATHDGV